MDILASGDINYLTREALTMMGLIGLLLLILLRVSRRLPTVAGSKIPGIATPAGSSSPNPQSREADGANSTLAA